MHISTNPAFRSSCSLGIALRLCTEPVALGEFCERAWLHPLLIAGKVFSVSVMGKRNRYPGYGSLDLEQRGGTVAMT